MNNKVIVFFIYFLVCLFFFLQYPIAGSLTGDLDTIANLAMFKHLKLYIDSIFIGSEATSQFCFPSKHTWLLYGADFGSGIIHIFFNYLGMNDLWANYMYISALFTLNCFTFFLLLNHLLNGKQWISFLSSFIFCFSHFALANLENPNVLIFFPSFLSLIYLIKYLQFGKRKYIFISILVGGILIYLSPTNFVMHIIIWTLLSFGFSDEKSFLFKIKFITYSAFCFFILIIPYIWFFIFKIYDLEVYNLIKDKKFAFGVSLHLNNLWNVLPEHLYSKSYCITENPWLSKVKSAYLGVVFYLVFFWSIFSLKKGNVWKIIFIVGLIIAVGPYFGYNFNKLFPSLMYPFYEYLHFDNYIRVPIRYFFISIFAATILIAKFFNFLESKGKGTWVLVLFFLIIIENVPFKMEKYTERQKIVLNPPISTFELNKNENSWNSLLFLPSSLFNYEGDRHEYTYMYWQSFFRKNMVNGNLALIPKERMNLNELIDNFDETNLGLLLKNHPVDAIVFVKEFANSSGMESLNVLNESTNLVLKVLEDDKMVVFEKK